jgi:hypothetical protein
LEAATPGNTLPSKQELLDFQARWMRPAGICAIAGAALLVAAGIVGSVGSADTKAEQLQDYQDHSSQLLLSSVVSAIGLLLFACPLYFLFFSARARSKRVRSFIGPLILVGALLAAVQGPLVSLGLKDASDDYAAGVGAVEAKARQAQPTAPPTQATTTTTGSSTTGSTTTPGLTPEQRASDAKQDFADDKVNDSSKIQAARIIGLIGALTLIAGTVYTLIWSMRTGLLTRFMATLGIAFIAALLLIPQLGPIGTVLWFAVLGLMLAGWWPRPLPPAWEAGEAIPWLRPGEDIGPPPEERGGSGTVEGSGREVSEEALPENGAGEHAQPQPQDTQGQRRKKRKRRK